MGPIMRLLISLLALGATAVSADDKTLCAEFNFENLKAMVVVKQSEHECARNIARWEVEFTEFNAELCPSGELNWHVHEYAGNGIRAVGAEGNAPGCDGDVAGGHYDPTFACGGASQNNGNGVCAVLRAMPQFPLDEGNGFVLGPYECSNEDQSGCEIGDQSGKLGKLTATVPTGRRMKSNKASKSSKSDDSDNKQKFLDTWINPISNIEGRSLVLHCCGADGCGPRLACAVLEDV